MAPPDAAELPVKCSPARRGCRRSGMPAADVGRQLPVKVRPSTVSVPALSMPTLSELAIVSPDRPTVRLRPTYNIGSLNEALAARSAVS